MVTLSLRFCCVLLLLGLVGCLDGTSGQSSLDRSRRATNRSTAGNATSSGTPSPPAAAAKQVPVGKNVVFEKEGDVRRVLVEATVCRPTYGLEVFLCRTHTKEHEAIVAAEVDARDIHKALLLAGAEPGSPVSYDPPRPPSGTLIKVSVRYKDASGKVVTKRAQEWIQDQKTKKPLDADWVFAGSQFFRSDEPGKPDEYLANGGDLIAVCSLQSAMLDLPIKSPTGLDERLFVINSDAIPPAETPVTVILEPVPDRKKPKK